VGRKRKRQWQYVHLFIACVITLSICGCATLESFSRRVDARNHLFRGNDFFQAGNIEEASREYEQTLTLSGTSKPGDSALFHLGLLYVHPGNSDRNYTKSYNYFRQLLKEFPGSPLAERAKIWTSVLKSLKSARKAITETQIDSWKQYRKYAAEKDREVNARVEKEIDESLPNAISIHIARGDMYLTEEKFTESLREHHRALVLSPKEPPGDSALFSIALIYAHFKNPQKNYKKSIVYFRRLLAEFPRSPLFEQARIWIALLESIEKYKEVDIEIEKKRKELTW